MAGMPKAVTEVSAAGAKDFEGLPTHTRAPQPRPRGARQKVADAMSS